MSRIWIVDGHNVIFAISSLKNLQVTGYRQEARRVLLDALRRFAQERNDRLLVVFDGGDRQRDQKVDPEPLLEVIYSARRPGGADERIIREARSLYGTGHCVTVVTNDVTTLAAGLPGGVDHLKVGPFWNKHIKEAERKAGKRVEGDFSDVEKEMLERASGTEPEDAAYTRRPARVGRCTAAVDAGILKPCAGKDALLERLRLKREKGRARHQRRFKRR